MGLVEDRSWTLVILVAAAAAVGPTVLRNSDADAAEQQDYSGEGEKDAVKETDSASDVDESFEVSLRGTSPDDRDSKLVLTGVVTRKSEQKQEQTFPDKLTEMLEKYSVPPPDKDSTCAISGCDREVVQDSARRDRACTNAGTPSDSPCDAVPTDGFLLHTLIALVPDPQLSAMGVYYDQVLESLVSAASESGFVKDRFYIPWQGSTAKEGSAEVSDSPGVMFFRFTESTSPQRAFDRLLVVFLVRESPVVGPNMKELNAAVDSASRLTMNKSTPLRIIGPMFSGSAAYLSHFLYKKRAVSGNSIFVVSGSATGSDVGALFEKANIPFQRTVISDESLIEFLKRTVCEKEPDARFVKLSEIGTGYGHNPDKNRENRNHSKAVGNSESETDKAVKDCISQTLREFQFPFHISELQAAQEKARGTNLLPNTPTLRQTLELKLSDENETSADEIPLSSRLTQYESELSLRQNIQRICRKDRLTYVVVVATNSRDVLFLSSEIRKYCPRVTLVTLGADLLFVHPDVSDTMEGVLSLSTYPLSSSGWKVVGRSPRSAFPSYIAQGLYNAAAVQLNKMTHSDRAPLYTYDLSGQNICDGVTTGPAMWLSMITEGGYQPLAMQPKTELHLYSAPKDTAPKTTQGAEIREHGTREISGRNWLATIALLITATIHICFILFFRSGRFFLKPEIRWVGDGTLTEKAERAWYRAATLGILICAGCFLTPIFHDLSFGWNLQTVLVVSAILLIPPLLFASYGAFSQGVSLVVRLWKTRPNQFATWRCTVGFSALIGIVGLCACTSYEWCQQVIHSPAVRGSAGALLLARMDRGVGMSPLTPLFFLLIGYYAWAFSGLRRLHVREGFGRILPLGHCCSKEMIRVRMKKLFTLYGGQLCIAETIVLASVAFHCLLFNGRIFATFEQPSYNLLLRIALYVLYYAVVSHFVRFTFGIRALVGFLKQINALPMVDACDRVMLKVSTGFGLRLGAPSPRPSDLALSAENLGVILGLIKKIGYGYRADERFVFRELEPKLRKIHAALQNALTRLAAYESGPRNRNDTLYNLTRNAHELFFRASGALYCTLRTIWDEREKAGAFHRLGSSEKLDLDSLLPNGARATVPTATLMMRALPPEVYLWSRMAEDFVMMRFATFLTQQMTIIRNLLLFSWLGAFMIVFAITSYPLQPPGLVMVFAMFVVGAVIAGSIVAMFILERNPVLRRLSGTEAGNFALKASFIMRLLIFVALPATVMLAKVYPALGGFLFSCLEPLGRLMP